ncbi:RimJ/RimL family protein N-acetyltransferase [Tumebacillus sp. BK434]|uniref:GNAT family N-acetyltransferase n=1 Tax=Tumebacillus sp. BK434 TaxID=2512169 RepID=UPI00105302AA|nr:GNAT family N-acetyltransferase [Tumebacillus sp. BK434]TCP58056.1 RimJ/RimL family protein N-acetyltransferase [Tumebacillus sp. BK434]
MKLEQAVLEGVRVRLVPLAREHAAGIYEAAQDEAIWTYLPYAIDSLERAEYFVEETLKRVEQGVDLAFVVIDKETDRIIGSTRYLDISIPGKSLEIGWTWYHPSVWRSRVNTECKYLLLRHAFEALGFIRVQIKTDVRNERSQNAIARLGAVREGVLRNHMIMSNGYVRDTVFFSVIDREWPDVKVRLEIFLNNE